MSTEFFNDQWRIPSNENQNKVSNYSMEFDGTNTKIDFGNVNNFQITDSFSGSCWVNLTALGAQYFISKQLGSGVYRGYIFSIKSNNTLQFALIESYPSKQIFVSSSETLAANTWYHLAFTYDGSNSGSGVKMYINGTPTTNTISSAGTIITILNTTDFQVSGRGGGNGNLVGKIDQVTIFDYALPATGTNSVATLYGGGTSVTNPMSLSPKPIAYYQLGDQSVDNGANYLVPNNSLSDYVFDFPVMNYTVNPDKIFLNNQAQVFNNATNFSFSGWFKINVDRNQNIFEIKDGSNYRFNINYYYVVDSLRFNIDTSGAGNYADAQNLISDGKIAIGEWFHYAGVFNGSGATNADRTKLYINGQEQTLFYGGTQATSLGAIGATNTISLGNLLSSAFIQFGGQASNIQMWDASLSSPEVITLYNNGSPYTGTQPQSSNLRFWYKLNAADTFNSSTSTWTIKDYAGSNDGTSSGMDSSNLVVSDLQQTSGYSPYALSFDGTNDFLNAGSASYLNGLSEFSISIWINLPTAADNKTIISDWNYNTSPFGHFALKTWNTSGSNFGLLLFIKQPSDAGSNGVSIPAVLTQGNWHNVVFSYDSGTVTCYVDGSVVAVTVSGTIPTTLTSQDGILTIGNWPGLSQYWPGKLSNIALWNTELTQANATEIYNQGAPSNLNTFSGTAPVAWWQIGSNSSYLADPNPNPPSVIGRWTCLDEIGSNNAESSNNMTNDAITDGPGYSANGLGTSSIDIKGDAPYSTANGLSENMDVLDRVTDVPS